MDLIKLILDFLNNPNCLKTDEEFRVNLNNYLDTIYQSLYAKVYNELNEINDFNNFETDQHLLDDNESEGAREDIEDGIEIENPLEHLNKLDLEYFENFFKMLNDFFNKNTEIRRNFENVYGENLSESINKISNFLPKINDVKESADLCNREGIAPTITEFKNILDSVAEYQQFHEAINNIIETGTNYLDIYTFFGSVITELLADTLQQFLQQVKKEFPEKKDNQRYLNFISNIFNSLGETFEDGRTDLLLSSYLIHNSEESSGYLYDLLNQIFLQYNDFLDSYIDTNNVRSFLLQLLEKGEINLDHEENNNGEASSNDNSFQNSLDQTINDVSSPETPQAETVETDPLKNIQKQDQKRIQEELKKSHQKFLDLKKNKQLSNNHNQEFIHGPQIQEQISEAFCQTIENILAQQNYAFSVLPYKMVKLNLTKAAFTNQNLFCSSNQSITSQQTVRIGYDGRVYLSKTGSHNSSFKGNSPHTPRGVLKTGPWTSHKGSKVSLSKQIKTTVSKGTIVQGKWGNNSQLAQSKTNTGRGTIIKGPGSYQPINSLGKVANGYIALFMIFPQVKENIEIIASFKSTFIDKKSAATNLGMMGASMWFFSKFIAKKHPKTAAGLMIYTAGNDLHHKINPHLKKYEKNRPGKTLYFSDQKSYLKSNPSCTDGRQVKFLNHLNPDYDRLSNIKPSLSRR